MLARIASRSAEDSCSITARRETTTLLRLRSSLTSLSSTSLPSRKPKSRIGRISTSEPGRKPRTPSTSTVRPPLTLPVTRPLTTSASSIAVSRRSQVLARLAFSRDRRVSPRPSSRVSKNTSTSSPTATSSSPLASRNCDLGTADSDFIPASTRTVSLSIPTTVPIIREPVLNLSCCKDSSNNSAKDNSLMD